MREYIFGSSARCKSYMKSYHKIGTSARLAIFAGVPVVVAVPAGSTHLHTAPNISHLVSRKNTKW